MSGFLQLTMRPELPDIPSPILNISFILVTGYLIYTFEKARLTEKEMHPDLFTVISEPT